MEERVNVKHSGLALLLVSALVAALVASVLTRQRGWANAAATTQSAPAAGRGAGALAARIRAVESYGKLPVGFEPNLGQFDRQVKFASTSAGYRLFLTNTGAVLSFGLPGEGTAMDVARVPGLDQGGSSFKPADPTTVSGPAQAGIVRRRLVLRLTLEGSNPAARVVAANQLPGVSNYYLGSNPKKWRTGILAYALVRCKHIYPRLGI
jgi:hypothetical protein